MSQQQNRVRNILTNQEDLAGFIKIVRGQINGLNAQKEQTKEQLKQFEYALNENENVLALLENWGEIMAENDITLINMAFQDIKKNMTKPTTVDNDA